MYWDQDAPGKAFLVRVMAWETYRSIVLSGPTNPDWMMLGRYDCIIGGIDLNMGYLYMSWLMCPVDIWLHKSYVTMAMTISLPDTGSTLWMLPYLFETSNHWLGSHTFGHRLTRPVQLGRNGSWLRIWTSSPPLIIKYGLKADLWKAGIIYPIKPCWSALTASLEITLFFRRICWVKEHGNIWMHIRRYQDVDGSPKPMSRC